MKLPRLATVEQPQAIGLDLVLLEVDDAGRAHVLLDPRVLDRVRIDSVEPLGQVTERAVALLLHRQNVLDLRVGEDALLDEQLTDRDAFCGQGRLLRKNCGPQMEATSSLEVSAGSMNRLGTNRPSAPHLSGDETVILNRAAQDEGRRRLGGREDGFFALGSE